MSPTAIPPLREFVVYIHDEIAPDQADEFPSWTQFNQVAKVSEEEFQLCGPSKCRENLSRGKHTRYESLTPQQTLSQQQHQSRPSVRFDLTLQPPHSTKRTCSTTTTKHRSKATSQLWKQSTPLRSTERQMPLKPTDESRRLPSPVSSPSVSPPMSPERQKKILADRLVVPLGTIDEPQMTPLKERIQNNGSSGADGGASATTTTTTTHVTRTELIRRRREQHADLVPPDILSLDLNSDKIFVPLPNGDESDSVSYVASSSDEDEDN